MKKILLVADLKGWIFERHCLEIKKRLSHKYEFGISFCRGDGNKIPRMSEDYDLVYVLDPMPIDYPSPDKTIIGLRCEWLYDEEHGGPQSLYDRMYSGKCRLMHVVNKRQYDVFKPIAKIPIMITQHGVDETVFDAKKYQKKDSHQITASFSGRIASDGGKGFQAVADACRRQNVLTSCAVYESKQRLSKEMMPNLYLSADFHICFSKNEGINNPVLEAGAMGLPVISTKCGVAQEIIDGTNGILINRNAEELERAISTLKDHDLRKKMGERMYETIMGNWTWAKKIKDYEDMFDACF